MKNPTLSQKEVKLDFFTYCILLENFTNSTVQTTSTLVAIHDQFKIDL